MHVLRTKTNESYQTSDVCGRVILRITFVVERAKQFSRKMDREKNMFVFRECRRPQSIRYIIIILSLRFTRDRNTLIIPDTAVKSRGGKKRELKNIELNKNSTQIVSVVLPLRRC